MVELNYYNEYSDLDLDVELLYNELFIKTINYLNLKQDFELSVRLVDNETIKQLNSEYRFKDYSTDVITFENDLLKQSLELGIPCDLGDIFISVDQALIQAQEYHHSLKRELSFLFVHGLLHTLGYDHQDEAQEKIMFTLQEVILSE
ncbi:MAG: rRNA maturation RNase YbeY [Bacilli bacterium]